MISISFFSCWHHVYYSCWHHIYYRSSAKLLLTHPSHCSIHGASNNYRSCLKSLQPHPSQCIYSTRNYRSSAELFFKVRASLKIQIKVFAKLPLFSKPGQVFANTGLFLNTCQHIYIYRRIKFKQNNLRLASMQMSLW